VRRRLVLSYLVLAALLLIALEVPLGIVAANHERDAVRASARQDAAILAALAGPALHANGSDRGPDLDDLTSHYAIETGAEVTIVDRNGKTVAYQPSADERGRPDATTDNSAALQLALTGRTAMVSHRDEGRPVEVAAVPVTDSKGQVVGAVQVSLPASVAEHRVHLLVAALLAFAAGALVVVTVVGFVLSGSVVRPLSDLEGAVHALETGDLDARTEPAGPPEIRSLGVSFNRMADQLGELITSQRRFIADASHQLRSPLAALRLRLEALDPADPEGSERHIEAAVEEVGRLSRLVDGLLEIARVEGTRPQRSTVDVGEVLRDRVEMWEAFAEERGVHLEVAASSDDLDAVAVPGHLEQILDNLLANALEVAPARSAIELQASRRHVDGRQLLAVDLDDAGPGMTEQQRHVAFTRFWQDDTQPTGTTGLGLAISRQLARASGGDLTLDVSPRGGLRATVLLEPHTRSGGPPA
jgi:signal transduction histidine kinase